MIPVFREPTHMFCSTIIPTVNRPSLSRTVGSVLRQDFDKAGFEVIVVNDSGERLAEAEWQDSPRVKVISTNHRERSVARNAGAAISCGKYLHFLDDDDILLPGALEAFWDVAQGTDAIWLHGDWQTEDNGGRLVAEFRPPLSGNISALLVAGEGLPLQASLVRAESFFELGGYDASPSITGVEDRDLGRRLALMGEVAHVPAIVARVRIGESGSTTQWSAIAERDRLGRERALGIPGSRATLRASARSSYWRGRVCRAYCASGAWNLRRRNIATAVSRWLAAVGFAGASSVTPAFWAGLRTRIK